MIRELYEKLFINLSILLSISIVVNALYVKKVKHIVVRKVLHGLFIGFIGIILIRNSVALSEGLVFDTRSILVSITGLFFGPIPTVVATSIIVVARILLGGSGTITGILVTLMSAIIGLVWNHYSLDRILHKNKLVWLEFYFFGIITSIAMLACMYTMPREMFLSTIPVIGLPVMLIYPIGTALISMVIFAKFQEIRSHQALEMSEQRFRTLFEQAPIGISISGKKEIIYMNSRMEKILDRSKEEVNKLGWESITFPDDLHMDLDQFRDLNAGIINEYTLNKRYIKPDNSIVWVKMSIASLDYDNPQGRNHICMVQDITDLVLSEKQTQLSKNQYKALYLEHQNKQTLLVSLLDSIPDLIFFKDTDGRYLGCNNAFEKFVGKSQQEIVGRSDFDLFGQQMATLFRDRDTLMMLQKSQSRNDELVTYPDGHQVYFETLKTPYYDHEGNVLGLIGISRDISLRKEKEQEIIYLNEHDVLTGLYNRAYFDQEHHKLDHEDHLPLSLIIGDINGLKLINDAFGHLEGDHLLVAIADILSSCCRKEDVIARIGGDEFCILLPNTDTNMAKTLQDRISEACESYSSSANIQSHFTNISLGHATKTEKSEPFEKVFKMAEEHMYRRKLLENRSLHSTIISSIKTTVFEKSNETQEHAERIALMSKMLGRALDLSEEELVSLELVSTLHDIGKISIDRNILMKQGNLNSDEWNEMKKHPSVGFRIAQTVPELRPIADLILCHHERWDGKGYPQGLKGEDIPLLSRILAITDSFDAMTHDRSYNCAMSKNEAIQEILSNAGTQFDPTITKIFVEKVLVEAFVIED